MLFVMIALAPAAAVVPAPARAVAAAYYDARTLPKYERCFYRYVWWPEGWEHTYLLTRSHQALLSDQGDFPVPIRVRSTTDLYRLDTRKSGWDKRLEVWENLGKIDFVFHAKNKYLEHAEERVYYPAGTYDGKRYKASYIDIKLKPGDVLERPAPWANPVVDAAMAKPIYAQDELRKLLWTETPIVMGPWWLVNTTRQIGLNDLDNGVGYYDWLGIKNRNDYFNFIGLDEKVARAKFTELRELVKKSGISDKERIVGRLRGATGDAWFTLDFKTQFGRGQPARNLRPGEAEHDAEEWIAPKPDGLPINSLNAAKADARLGIKAGDVQATAPDFIGANKVALASGWTNDPRIHPNSCWDCHGVKKDYLIGFDEWARNKFRPGKAALTEYDEKTRDELRFAYLRDINRALVRSREDYAYAIARLTRTGAKNKDPGLTVAGFTRFYQGAYYKYLAHEEGVTLETAAAELGVPPQQFLEGIKVYNEKARGRGQSDLIISDFLDTPPTPITRRAWEDSYQLAMMIALQTPIPELLEKVKAFNGRVSK